MSRADIGRTSRPRMVNATNSQRPLFVRPRTKYRSSADECDASKPNAIGTLRKTSSISQSVTPCFGQFFPMFPSSQSHPSQSDGSSFTTCLCISQEYTVGQATPRLRRYRRSARRLRRRSLAARLRLRGVRPTPPTCATLRDCRLASRATCGDADRVRPDALRCAFHPDAETQARDDS